MDVICYCFQQKGSPLNSDDDGEQAEKWGLITHEMINPRDMDDEKVKEHDPIARQLSKAFEMQTSSDDDNGNDDDDGDMDDEEHESHAHDEEDTYEQNESEVSDSMPFLQSETSKTATFNISEIQTKYDAVLEDTPSTFDPHTAHPFGAHSVTTNTSSVGYTWEEATASLTHNDSLYSNASSVDASSSCANCIHHQHIQKQLEIQMQTIRERNTELEDKLVDAQTNEENTKRLCDELREDLEGIQSKYDSLIVAAQDTKGKHDTALQEMRNTFEKEIQNMEKSYQDMVHEKNALELSVTETQDKLGKSESDLMHLHNAFSTLQVQKSRVEEDSKAQAHRMEAMRKQEGEKREGFEKDIRELMETIREQQRAAVTEKENNELTSNILKDQMKSLHREIADLEEEKKALQESVSLYEEQMNAAQLMDNTSLHLIDEESEESGGNQDEEAGIIIIPEAIDEETEMFGDGTMVYDAEYSRKKRHSKSNNMSISELEPAVARALPFHHQPQLSEENDDDSVYINYDIDNSNKIGPLTPMMSAGSHSPGTLALMNPVSSDTPPEYELEEEADIEEEDPVLRRLTHARSTDGNAALPVIAELHKLRISAPRTTRSVSDVMNVTPPSTKGTHGTKRSPHGYSASVTSMSTFQGINVWKNRYSELKSEHTMNAKQMAQKDIELDSLRDKIKSLEAVIAGDADKIESLCADLESMRESYMELHANELKLRSAHEKELNELNRELNHARDEIATLSSENERYSEYKEKTTKDTRKKGKLHTKQLKFNEELMNEIFDLNNEVKQLTDMNAELKSKLESVLVDSAQDVDHYEAVKRKLHRAVKERKEFEKEATRVKNKVAALNKEVLSLNQTISNLESLFNEHSIQLVSKNKRIKHLGKQREAQQQSIHRLSSKLKKRERHMKGFLQAEEDSFKKSHSAKDKRLNMLRQTNKKLVVKLEEAEKKILRMNGAARETQTKLKCEIENRRMGHKALQVEISKLTADHNKMAMQKQEVEYERDSVRKRNKELMAQMKMNEKSIKKSMEWMVDIEDQYSDVLMFLDAMQIKEDALYRFVDRCRNTFLNTSKPLTNKLTSQLIEGCDRAICVYYHAVSHFKSFINQCLSVKQQFKNIEESYLNLEFHCYEVYQSALCSIYQIGGLSSSAANYKQKRDSIHVNPATNILRSTRKILNPKNKDVIPKLPLIANDLIRKPVQSETPKVPMAAYNQIAGLLAKNIENALNDLRKVTLIYSQPLNVEIYKHNIKNDNDEDEEDEKEDEGSEEEINWNSLSMDPSTERVYPGLKERNDKRFEEIMNELNESSKQFRKEQTKKIMQLDGAWHKYDIDIASIRDTETTHHHRHHHTGTYLSPLTLKVSSQGMHSKRYSIF